MADSLDLNQLNQALKWWQDHPETNGINQTLHRLNNLMFIAAARAYADFLESFPSDEDVEVAAKAMLGGEEWWLLNGPETRLEARRKARVALLAVADARRTEEEG